MPVITRRDHRRGVTAAAAAEAEEHE